MSSNFRPIDGGDCDFRRVDAKTFIEFRTHSAKQARATTAFGLDAG